MTFKLLEDRIAVLAEEVATKTESGLHFPDTMVNNVPRYGTVVHVGVGHWSEHAKQEIPIAVKKGDRVFFHRGSGETWEIEGTEYVVLSPREIIGVETEGEET